MVTKNVWKDFPDPRPEADKAVADVKTPHAHSRFWKHEDGYSRVESVLASAEKEVERFCSLGERIVELSRERAEVRKKGDRLVFAGLLASCVLFYGGLGIPQLMPQGTGIFAFAGTWACSFAFGLTAVSRNERKNDRIAEIDNELPGARKKYEADSGTLVNRLAECVNTLDRMEFRDGESRKKKNNAVAECSACVNMIDGSFSEQTEAELVFTQPSDSEIAGLRGKFQRFKAAGSTLIGLPEVRGGVDQALFPFPQE